MHSNDKVIDPVCGMTVVPGVAPHSGARRPIV